MHFVEMDKSKERKHVMIRISKVMMGVHQNVKLKKDGHVRIKLAKLFVLMAFLKETSNVMMETR